MNPYFHIDNDYYRSQDEEWDRVIDLERKAEEIRSDPDLLEKAIEEYAQQMQVDKQGKYRGIGSRHMFLRLQGE